MREGSSPGSRVIDSTREHKKLSDLVGLLKERLSYYAEVSENLPEFVEAVIELYEKEELYRLGTDSAWRRLAETWPDLEDACSDEKEKIVGLLKAIHRQKKIKNPKETLTITDLKSLPDLESDGIANFVIYKKIYQGVPTSFYVKVWLSDGEIKEEVIEPLSIPQQTAPSPDFYEKNYGSLREVYYELNKIHTDYIAFSKDNDIDAALITLGTIASYFREIFYSFPYFDYISGEPESGKTTAMKMQVFTAFYGTIASSISEPLLFREINDSHAFYGLDNIERIFLKPKDYAALIDWLLSSYSRDIPCKRLEKRENGKYVVVSFDGYGIKAFTHIRDFPYYLRALRSRCIQIVMQPGTPKKFYPAPEKFREIRDKLYLARLKEYEKVKDIYESLINANILKGRVGDLYYPLLTIAKLVDDSLFNQVKDYANTEPDRLELNESNKVLISVLYNEELYGSIASQDIKEAYRKKLIALGLFDPEKELYTRTITSRLKKLGFPRDKDKKTDNKSWFIIEKEKVIEKAILYGVIYPEKPNLVNLPNFKEGADNEKERSTEEREVKERSTEERDFDDKEDVQKLTKLSKLANGGYARVNKNNVAPCELCGETAVLTFYNNMGVCQGCLNELKEEEKKAKEKPTKTVNIEDVEEDGSIPEAYDKDFQTKQNKEARKRLEKMGLLEKKDCDGDGCELQFRPSPNLEEDECSRCLEIKPCEWQIKEGDDWLPICESCKAGLQNQGGEQ